MSSLILPRRFASQPQGEVGLDRSNVLADVHSGFSATNPVTDITGIGSLTFTTPSTYFIPKATPAGLALGTTQNIGALVTPRGYSGGSGQSVTCTAVIAPNAALTSANNTLGTVGPYYSPFVLGDGTNPYLGALWRYAGETAQRFITDTVPVVVGDVYIVTLVVEIGIGLRFYRDGILVGTYSTTKNSVWTLDTSLRLSSLAGPLLFYQHNRALLHSEVLSLHDNPWQIFRAKPRVLYFDVGGGISGTLAVTLENFIGSITGTTTVTGTVNNTIDNVTSSITGTTGIVGTISNTLENNTSSIVGTVSIIGTISNTIEDFTSSISGALGESVTGNISVTLQDNTPDIIGTTAITGNISVTIDVYESDIVGTTTIVGTITQQMENITSSIHGFIGDEDIQARLRTLLGMGT